ncbi:hypothetical protein [Pseudomonas sp. RIT-PI-S]|uniref:hypothetical protein n=1 Tax=Pseudomonas sp. RIT-PI-S TaxID=3035295 RepID=UPI0021D87E4B|nr:hypothetical protein [Pseudomonas sp. RIT-PI-S]
MDTEVGIGDEETLVTIIRENAEDEAIQYAEDQLYRHNMDMTAEAKTREVMRSLIETTPLESTLASSWEAAKSSRRAFDEKIANNRKHASNMFPNAVLRRATARAAKPDARVVNRNPEQVSRLSRVLHDRIFGGDDAFFGWPLSRYYA